MPHPTVTSTLRELWDYRVYLKYETLGRIRVRHKDTYLGFVWWVLDPLFFLGIYYFVFGIIFHRGGPQYIVFLFCALLPWRWFVTSVSEACVSIRSAQGLLKQIYFPKLIVPLSSIFTNTVSFLYGLIVLAIILRLFRIVPGWNLLWFPVVVATQFAFSIGLGVILANLNVYMKDTSILLRHVFSIWFYASPGIYSMNMIPEPYRRVLSVNPFAVLFTAYRETLMYDQRPHIRGLSLIFVGSLALIWFGVRQLAKNQGQYAKIL